VFFNVDDRFAGFHVPGCGNGIAPIGREQKLVEIQRIAESYNNRIADVSIIASTLPHSAAVRSAPPWLTPRRKVLAQQRDERSLWVGEIR